MRGQQPPRPHLGGKRAHAHFYEFVFTETLEGFVSPQPRIPLAKEPHPRCFRFFGSWVLTRSGFYESRSSCWGMRTAEEASARSVWYTLFWDSVYFMGDGHWCVCLFAIDKTKIVPPRGCYLPFPATFLQLNCTSHGITNPRLKAPDLSHFKNSLLQKGLNNLQSDDEDIQYL